MVEGELGAAAVLVELCEEAGLTVERQPGAGCLRVDGVMLALTDGRSATERAAANGEAELVLFDLALDYRAASRIAVATADQASPVALTAAAGLFQALGKQVSVIDDAPGLIVMDEPTSALDAHSEEALRQTIRRLGDLTTVVLVAHRESTLAACDRVVMFDGGRIETPTDGRYEQARGMEQQS